MRHVLIGLLLMAHAAKAETWQQVAEFETGSVSFIDTAGITRSGEHRRAWFKLVFNSDQAIPAAYGVKPPDAGAFRWEKTQRYFNCSERTFAIAQSILHSADDQVVASLEIPANALKFRAVQPGTVAEKNLDTVCTRDEVREEAAGAPTQVTRAANPMDYYPAGSIRRQEQGAPIIKVCVGPDGQLLREPIVTNTSGFPELDAAAIKVAKATRYAAGTENGKPLPESCVKFKIKFVLNH